MPPAQASLYQALCTLLTREGVSYRTVHHAPTLPQKHRHVRGVKTCALGGKPLW
jgi:hypothetical protein